MVTELFAAINDVVSHRRPLPAYKQAVFSDGTLLSEFISGKTPMDVGYEGGAANLNDASGDLLAAGKWNAAKDSVLDRLRWLQAVATKIGLTDLHEDDLIFDPARQMVVPIDLEAFDEGKATGLYGRAFEPHLSWEGLGVQSKNLSDQIDELIAGFNRAKGRRPSGG
jgi:hypothetical protein